MSELGSGCDGCKWYEWYMWEVTNDVTEECKHDPKPDNLFEIQDYDIECPYKERTGGE